MKGAYLGPVLSEVAGEANLGACTGPGVGVPLAPLLTATTLLVASSGQTGLASSASFLPTLALAVMVCTRSSRASVGRAVGRGGGLVSGGAEGEERGSLLRGVPGLDMLSLWKTDPLAFSLSSCNNNDTGLILILVLCLFIYNINFDLVLKCFPAS
jgi:hypothetical protein